MLTWDWWTKVHSTSRWMWHDFVERNMIFYSWLWKRQGWVKDTVAWIMMILACDSLMQLDELQRWTHIHGGLNGGKCSRSQVWCWASCLASLSLGSLPCQSLLGLLSLLNGRATGKCFVVAKIWRKCYFFICKLLKHSAIVRKMNIGNWKGK